MGKKYFQGMMKEIGQHKPSVSAQNKSMSNHMNILIAHKEIPDRSQG
jgi:hypothetical protein